MKAGREGGHRQEEEIQFAGRPPLPVCPTLAAHIAEMLAFVCSYGDRDKTAAVVNTAAKG